jgi:hypothetical protein
MAGILPERMASGLTATHLEAAISVGHAIGKHIEVVQRDTPSGQLQVRAALNVASWIQRTP